MMTSAEEITYLLQLIFQFHAKMPYEIFTPLDFYENMHLL